MRQLTWRQAVTGIALVLLGVALTLWALTLYLWYRIEPSYEQPNLLAAAAISTILSFISFLRSPREPDTPISEPRPYSPTPARQARDRQRLLGQVKSFWIEGFLEDSLRGLPLLMPGMRYEPDVVEHPWDEVVLSIGPEGRQVPAHVTLSDIYLGAGRSLLILGSPGAGKTTGLLQLGRDLLRRAEMDESEPIPVILNLNSWRSGFASLESWIARELQTRYYESPGVARYWMEVGGLALLLDGLDEVQPTRRDACAAAINDHLARRATDVAVCSRTEDYLSLRSLLRLRRAVSIMPLTSEQVSGFFDAGGIGLAYAHDILNRDADLQELYRSPLFLSAAARTFSARALGGVGVEAFAQDRRRELFAGYVAAMLARRRSHPRFRPSTMVGYLHWLALQLSRRGEAAFAPTQLDTSWLGTAAEKAVHALLFVLFLCPGLAILFAEPALQLPGCGASVLGITAGLAVSLDLGLSKPNRSRIGLFIAFTLAGGVVLDTFQWELAGQWAGPLSVALLFGYLLARFGPEIPEGLARVRDPDARALFFRTLTEEPSIFRLNILLGSLLVVFLAVLAFSLGAIQGTLQMMCEFWLEFAARPRVSAFALVVLAGFVLGAAEFTSSFAVRVALASVAALPFNLTRFLNDAADRLLLRRVGRSYVFVHSLLQDYFVSLESNEG